MSAQRLQGCREANRAKLRRGHIGRKKHEIRRPALITQVSFSQECWGRHKSSRGNQILKTKHLVRGDRKRCVSRFYIRWDSADLRHLGLSWRVSVVLIADRSRLEDKDTGLEGARGAGKARQRTAEGKGDPFLRGLNAKGVKAQQSCAISLEREGKRERGVYLKVFEEVGSLGTLPSLSNYLQPHN